MELPDITPQEGFDKLGFLRPNPTVGFQIPRFFFNVIQTVLSLTLSHLINKKIQVFFCLQLFGKNLVSIGFEHHIYNVFHLNKGKREKRKINVPTLLSAKT